MPKNKLPSFQFYPGDWMKDPDLRRCTHAAKGVLMDALCIMFESDERGVLATAGVPWTDQEVARAIGGDYDVTLSCLRELVDKRVLGRIESGAIYSRRMVREEQHRRNSNERVKRHRNAPCNANVTRPSSSSSSTSVTGRGPPDPPGDPAREMDWELSGIPPHLATDAFRSLLASFVVNLREKKKPPTPSSWRAQLAYLCTLSLEEATAAVTNSLRNNYNGIYPPNPGKGKTSPKPEPPPKPLTGVVRHG